MNIPALSAVAETIAAGAAALRRRHRLAQRNSAAICYLEGMPAYLRKDIGLTRDAEIRPFVENGRVREAADGDVRRNLETMLPPV